MLFIEVWEDMLVDLQNSISGYFARGNNPTKKLFNDPGQRSLQKSRKHIILPSAFTITNRTTPFL